MGAGKSKNIKEALNSPENEYLCRKAFNALDSDKSGHLSKEEFARLAKIMLKTEVKKETKEGGLTESIMEVADQVQEGDIDLFVDGLFAAVDITGTDTISFEEFVDFLNQEGSTLRLARDVSSSSLSSFSPSSSSSPSSGVVPGGYHEATYQENENFGPEMGDEVPLRFTLLVPELEGKIGISDEKEKQKKKKIRFRKKKQTIKIIPLENVDLVMEQISYLKKMEAVLEKEDQEERVKRLDDLLERLLIIQHQQLQQLQGSEEIKELTEEQQIAEVELRMAELNSPFGKNDHPLGMSVAAEKMLLSSDEDVTKIECSICWDEHPSTNMLSLGCEHFYCNQCLIAHLEYLITSGKVLELCCPEPTCKLEVSEQEVRECVPPDLYRKYIDFSSMARLKQNPNARWCPKQGCAMAVVWNKEKQGRMVVCPACDYKYCFNCRKEYHEHENCELSKQEYEDHGFLEYLNSKRKTVKPCPVCNTATSKTEGCNKMHCTNCGSNWCWLCNEKISSSKPYDHFSKGKCQGKLHVEGDSVPEADVNIEFRREELFVRRKEVSRLRRMGRGFVRGVRRYGPTILRGIGYVLLGILIVAIYIL